MRVGVVGASARAAVHSLARAGFSAWAVDLFADRDLARIAPCKVCPATSYPDALPELARDFPRSQILYTGGLENYPQVLAGLADDHELWGNPPSVTQLVRDPIRLATTLQAYGLQTPRLIPPGEPAPPGGHWLSKSLRSSGGQGVRQAKPGDPPNLQRYFQEFIPGKSYSAVFVDQLLFGITRQLVGEQWVHSQKFTYSGSIGPITLSKPLIEKLVFLGAMFHREFKVRGIWNVDFIINSQQLYVIETNPRYSASVEVLEHALGRSIFHPDEYRNTPHPNRHVGKAIYYASQRVRFPATGPWEADLTRGFDPWRMPTFADIPAPGTIIEHTQPVLSILQNGSSPAECHRKLQSHAVELDQLLLESRHEAQ